MRPKRKVIIQKRTGKYKYTKEKWNHRVIFSFLLFTLFFIPALTQAQSYYVAPWGDDNNSGSKGSPWQTINKAANTLEAGETVYIRGGKYVLNSTIEPKNSGTASAWITYTAYKDEEPVIIARDKEVSSDAAFVISNRNYIRVKGLNIKESYGQGFGVSQSDYIELIGNSTDSTWKSGIGVWGDAGSQDPCEHIRIIGNKVTKPNKWAMLPPNQEPPRWPPHEGITLGRVENYEVAYNEVSHGDKEGIDSKGPCNNGRIHHNYIHDLPRVAIYVDAWTNNSKNFDIYENTIVDCNYGVSINSEDGQEVDSVHIHHNRIIDMGRIGMGIGSSEAEKISNIAITNNTFYMADHAMGISSNSYDIKILNNIFSKIEWAPIPSNIDTAAQNIQIDYNYGYEDAETTPGFVDSAGYNFHLKSNSPAIDAGHPDDKYNDPDGSRNDQGAFYYGLNSSTPAAPSNLNLSPVGTDQINLEWEDNSNREMGYKIERKRGNGAFTEIMELGKNDTVFSDYGLLPDSNYTYRVKAFNKAGPSGYTAEKNAKTQDDGYSAQTYNLTVTNGSRSGNFEEGAVLNLSADPPPAGKYFVKWTGDTTYIDNPEKKNVSLTMPATDISLAAQFKESPYFTLTVENGTGDGEYQVREKINISAEEAPEGKMFKEWTGNVEYIDNPKKPDATVTMPFKNITITADYKDSDYDPNTLVASEDFSGGTTGDFYHYPSGSISTEPWNEGAARYGERGYLIADSDPLKYGHLKTTPLYASGGHKYKSIETILDTEGVFNEPPDYTNSEGEIGFNDVMANTLYMSFLARDEGANTKNFWIALSGGQFPWQPDYAVTNSNSKWTLRLDGTKYASSKDAVDGETALIVLKMEFLDDSTTRFSMYINPTELDGPEPENPDVTTTDSTSFTFTHLSIMLGNSVGQGALDEIRFGTSFAAVTPEIFKLTVENGSGSGEYRKDSTVNIEAGQAPEGKQFDVWTGDTTHINDPDSAQTTIIMPDSNITVTATYKDLPTYALTVENGSGDGDYLENETITIEANPAPENQQFNRWTGDTSNVENTAAATTTVTMPDSNITVSATYKELPTYTLTVENGSGGGDYYENDTVTIEADHAPEGKEFDGWSGDTSHIKDTAAVSTILIMPDSNVTVTATYVEITGISNNGLNNQEILIYPNPASEKIEVESPVTIHTISIVDVKGNLIRKQSGKSGKNVRLNVSGLPAGYYYIRLYIPGDTMTVKPFMKK